MPLSLREIIKIKAGDTLLYQHPQGTRGVLTEGTISEIKSLCAKIDTQWFDLRLLDVKHHEPKKTAIEEKAEEFVEGFIEGRILPIVEVAEVEAIEPENFSDYCKEADQIAKQVIAFFEQCLIDRGYIRRPQYRTDSRDKVYNPITLDTFLSCRIEWTENDIPLSHDDMSKIMKDFSDKYKCHFETIPFTVRDFYQVVLDTCIRWT